MRWETKRVLDKILTDKEIDFEGVSPGTVEEVVKIGMKLDPVACPDEDAFPSVVELIQWVRNSATWQPRAEEGYMPLSPTAANYLRDLINDTVRVAVQRGEAHELQ